jgi:hypothetical protein
MGKGLREFDQTDSVISQTFLPRIVLSSFFTAGWYFFAKNSRLFTCKKMLTNSLPLAFIASFYLSRGIAYHYQGVRQNVRLTAEARERNHENYMREMRAKRSSH